MTLLSYIESVRKFALYKEKNDEGVYVYKQPKNLVMAYLSLGFSGEAGEVADKVKKLIRDSGVTFDNVPSLSPEEKMAIAHELGDVLWYVAMLCEELAYPVGSSQWDFNEIFEQETTAENSMLRYAVESTMTLCEIAAKAYRLPKEGSLHLSLCYICRIANFVSCNLDEIAQMNIAKLTDRFARGKAHGSGDNR